MFAWARDRGHVVATLIPKVDLPAGRRRERLPTDEETERILREAKPDFAVIYRALRQCGARPGELAAATMDDILGGEIVLKKHKTSRKSGRARRIWIGEKLQALIDQATSGRTTGPIFVDQRGRSWTVQRLSRRFRTIRNRLELSRELVLYTTRHEHATKICAAHGIYVAQQALGHASIKTTQRYVNVDPDQQRSAQDDV